MTNKGEIVFYKEFYTKSSVDKVKEDFSDLCKCEITEKSDYYQVLLSEIADNEINLIDDFKNHVLLNSILTSI